MKNHINNAGLLLNIVISSSFFLNFSNNNTKKQVKNDLIHCFS